MFLNISFYEIRKSRELFRRQKMIRNYNKPVLKKNYYEMKCLLLLWVYPLIKFRISLIQGEHKSNNLKFIGLVASPTILDLRYDAF